MVGSLGVVWGAPLVGLAEGKLSSEPQSNLREEVEVQPEEAWMLNALEHACRGYIVLGLVRGNKSFFGP